MKPQVHNGVLAGMVQSTDGMSRSPSAPSIHADPWVRAMKSGEKHRGRDGWRHPEGSAGVVGMAVLVVWCLARLDDGGRCRA
jgi:hypothetical protein